MPDSGNRSGMGSSASEDHEDVLIRQMMGFPKEDDEVAAQADLTSYSSASTTGQQKSTN
jgi:hypothetical protein